MSNASSSRGSASKDQQSTELAHAPIAPVAPVPPTAQNKAHSQLPSQPASRVPWGPVSAVLFTIALYIAGQFAAAILIMAALMSMGCSAEQSADWVSSVVTGQFVYILLAEILTVGGVIWFLRRRQIPLSSIGWNGLKLRYLGIALVGFGVYFVSYVMVTIIASHVVPSLNFDQEQQIGFETAHSSLDLTLTAISLVVLPPLAEEILFRGFLFGGLRRRYMFVPAAIITSLMFAVGHLQFGSGAPLLWVAALDTFVLSLVLCYIREKTDSLWPGIFIHAIKNALAFSVLFLFK